jgi:hypothetical protein
MAEYLSDVAVKGTILRQSHQEEAAATISVDVRIPNGTVLTAGDTVRIARLAPFTALTYVRARMPGLNNGASSGAQGTLGWDSEGTLLGVNPDVDGYSAALDDGVGTFMEADLTGTRGTVFPGTGPAGGKLIYDNGYVDIVWTLDNVAPATATAGDEVITFVLEYKRVDLESGPYDKGYTAAPIVLTPFPEDMVFDYNGEAA